MPEDHFDERVAQWYDTSEDEMFDPTVVEPAVSFLATLAGRGAALELGIGTGRVALPLSHRRTGTRHRSVAGDDRETAS